jgi:hypothetical protein
MRLSHCAKIPAQMSLCLTDLFFSSYRLSNET